MFLVDANQAWTVAEAVEFVNRTRDFVELRWFEEPCQWPDDRRAMQAVRFKTGRAGRGRADGDHPLGDA